MVRSVCFNHKEHFGYVYTSTLCHFKGGIVCFSRLRRTPLPYPGFGIPVPPPPWLSCTPQNLLRFAPKYHHTDSIDCSLLPDISPNYKFNPWTILGRKTQIYLWVEDEQSEGFYRRTQILGRHAKETAFLSISHKEGHCWAYTTNQHNLVPYLASIAGAPPIYRASDDEDEDEETSASQAEVSDITQPVVSLSTTG